MYLALGYAQEEKANADLEKGCCGDVEEFAEEPVLAIVSSNVTMTDASIPSLPFLLDRTRGPSDVCQCRI